jgi:hypothetical protein
MIFLFSTAGGPAATEKQTKKQTCPPFPLEFPLPGQSLHGPRALPEILSAVRFLDANEMGPEE